MSHVDRDVVPAVLECPLNPISLANCRKCPHFSGYDSYKKKVSCGNLTPHEAKMKPEPATVKEPKARW